MLWVDGLFKVADKLIDLIKIAEERRRRSFKDHIDPIFIELAQIHKDYISTFEEVLDQLRERPQPIEVVRSLLKERKIELEHLRVKLASLASAYTTEKARVGFPQSTAKFFEAVLDYFQTASGKAIGYRGRFTDLLEYMDEAYFETKQLGKYPTIAMVYKYRSESGELVGDDFGYKLYEVIEAAREKWNAVAVAYAEAKVELMQ